ncbi:MAG: hypothetical protein ABR503_08845 [Chitinophagaceae bacterium]
MNLSKFFYRITHWETWHYLAKYIPLAPAWLWYCLKARSMWFFTPSNPTLTFGGFEGESKREMYDHLPPGSYPKSIYISPKLTLTEVEKLLFENGYDYPFAVKPDVGMMGFMFRKIENAEQFKTYHELMPVDYIVQEHINYPLEVSVFYYRFPGAQKGTITGFLRKEFLQVTGDGKSTLWELVLNYPRVRFRLEEMKAKHEHRLGRIIPAGEIFCLSPALNLSRGGKLVSLANEKDESLLKIFDDLSHYTKTFYYGRYDIKCSSIEELKQGKNFSILEYNGSGAEPHHIYGNGNNLFQAYKIVLQHWNVLYKISKHNHRSGIKYWKYNEGLKFLRKAKQHFKMLKQLDAVTEL